jgi:maltokinase
VSEVPQYLSDWITGQRWYSGKGRAPVWERLGGFELPDPTGEARITVHFLLDAAEPPLLYQVPLTERRVPVGALADHLVGSFEGGSGTEYLYDGPHDPAGAAAILRLMLDGGEARPDDGSSGLAARGHLAPGVEPAEIVSAKVLSGEQSNTSIIYRMAAPDGTPADPVICKVFRSLHHGDNPDVTLLSALAGAGSRVGPLPVGHINGQWRDSGEPTGFAHGHLAFAQEFLSGVEDAWRVALAAAERGDDFAERARTLGEATAEMHTTLAEALPTGRASADDIDAVVRSMRQRYEQALAEVPSIAAHRPALEQVYADVASGPWPPMQRIHGDFHLGQVLSAPDRGWVILDFEGEPLRPMAERAQNDSPLRDVAGMLRSFDYVAGSVAQSDPDAADAARAWADAAREAFLRGYSARAGMDLGRWQVLLDAFEIDKALYEAVYEARNRPAWLSIPTTAIDSLLGGR